MDSNLQFRDALCTADSAATGKAVGVLTVVFFRTGRFWVHYADGDER